MNWFQRHINLSLILFWMGGLAPVMLLIPYGGEDFFWALFTYLSLLLVVDGWALRQKGRSLFNLFYVLMGIVIGQIIFLCLTNKRRLVIKGTLPSFNVSTNVS